MVPRNDPNDYPIFDAWDHVLEVFESYGPLQREEDIERCFIELLSFLRRPDFSTLTEETRFELATVVYSFGEVLILRYREQKGPADLDRAVTIFNEAVALARKEVPEHIRSLINLGYAFLERYRRTGNAQDLDQAIQRSEEAFSIIQPNAPERPAATHNLARGLQHRSEISNDIGHLERAIDLWTEAIACLGMDSPERSAILKSLANALVQWTAHTAQPQRANEYWGKAITVLQPTEQIAFIEKFGKCIANRFGPARESPSSFVERWRRLTSVRDLPDNRGGPQTDSPDRVLKPQHVRSYAEVMERVRQLRDEFQDMPVVFRGQTSFHGGRLTPSLARASMSANVEDQLRWTLAVSDILRTPSADPLMTVDQNLKSLAGVSHKAEAQPTETPYQLSPFGPLAQAILQHYGARSEYLDVTMSPDVALWFAHHSHNSTERVITGEEVARLGIQCDEGEPLAEFDVAWYEPAWQCDGPKKSVTGYLFVIVPNTPVPGTPLRHGDFLELPHQRWTRMEVQQAGVIYCDASTRSGDVAGFVKEVFEFDLPLAGVEHLHTAETLRLFPLPAVDPIYSKILWEVAFWTPPDRPNVQVRRIRIPEYYSKTEVAFDSVEWLSYRDRDEYLRPSQVFPYVLKHLKHLGIDECTIGGERLLLKDAVPLLTTFPSMVIPTEVPSPSGSSLDVCGSKNVFLEYDPLQACLSARHRMMYSVQLIDPDRKEPEGLIKMVPLGGVRAVWVAQVGDLFWCRVFAHDNAQQGLAGWNITSGRVFRFEPPKGDQGRWFEMGRNVVMVEGTPPVSLSHAQEYRVERAALLHALGIVQHVSSRAWRLEPVPGSVYRLLIPTTIDSYRETD